jgi:hypothetical protein
MGHGPQPKPLHSGTKSPLHQGAAQKVGNLNFLGDASTGTFRSLVPRNLCQHVFGHLHGATHPGMRATRSLISSRYGWKRLSNDVTARARACLHCQRAKIHRHTQVPPQHVPVPMRRFRHIHVDLEGNLPASPVFINYPGQNFPLPLSDPYRHHHNSRLHECSVSGVSEQIRGNPGGHHIRTAVPTSPPPCGPPCATCSTSSRPRQQPAICSPMVWWNASTAASGLAARVDYTGQTTLP